MLTLFMSLMCAAPNAPLALEPYETRQLTEQYDHNAARCDCISCTDEELDGLDRDLMILLGRRAAVLRQRSRLAALSKLKGHNVAIARPDVRACWLEQMARELGVPTAFVQPIVQLLSKAAQEYESQTHPSP